MNQLPLCRHCKHARRDVFLGWTLARCVRLGLEINDNIREDLVSGKRRRMPPQYCAVERGDYKLLDVCAVEGRYFEQRPPTFLERLFSRWQS